MLSLKRTVRDWLESRGLYVRRINGLQAGISLHVDWKIRLNLPVPEVILDIGAHRGATAIYFASVFEQARIFAFEPEPSNFAVLERNVSNHRCVVCVNAALGLTDGQATLRIAEDSFTHTLSRTSRGKFTGETSVPLTTLDSFVTSNCLKNVGLIKIDTEGYERAVLRGGGELLAGGRVLAILAEASLSGGDTIHTSLVELQSDLEPLGFHLVGIYDQCIFGEPHRLGFFNALFVCKNPSPDLT